MAEPRLAALPLTLVYEELLETSLSSHFLITKEKYWSTNTELNDKSSVAIHVFLIFNNVITSCRAY